MRTDWRGFASSTDASSLSLSLIPGRRPAPPPPKEPDERSDQILQLKPKDKVLFGMMSRTHAVFTMAKKGEWL